MLYAALGWSLMYTTGRARPTGEISGANEDNKNFGCRGFCRFRWIGTTSSEEG